MPIPPYGSMTIISYQQTVFELLIGDEFCDIWLVVRQSHLHEYAVFVSRRWIEGMAFDELPYVAYVTRPEEAIWRRTSIPGEKSKSVGAIGAIRVIRKSADIQSADARQFIDSWFAALQNVQYGRPSPKNSPSTQTTDGVVFDFYADHRHGRTHSPTDGVPLLMSESGVCLAQFVIAPDEARDGIMQRCREINKKIDSATRSPEHK